MKNIFHITIVTIIEVIFLRQYSNNSENVWPSRSCNNGPGFSSSVFNFYECGKKSIKKNYSY